MIPTDGSTTTITRDNVEKIYNALEAGKEIVVRSLCAVFRCIASVSYRYMDSGKGGGIRLYFEFISTTPVSEEIGLPFVSGFVEIPEASDINEDGTYTCTFHIHSYRYVMNVDLATATIGGTTLNSGFNTLLEFCKTNKPIYGRLSSDSKNLLLFDVVHISSDTYPTILKSNIPRHSGGAEGLKNYELVISSSSKATLYLIGDSTEAPMDGKYYVRRQGEWINLTDAITELLGGGSTPTTASNGVYILCTNGLLYTRTYWESHKYKPVGVAVITDDAKFAVAMEDINEEYPWCPSGITPSVISGMDAYDTGNNAKNDFSGVENTTAILSEYIGKTGFAAEQCDGYSSKNLQENNYLGSCGEWCKIPGNASEFDACMVAIGGTSIWGKEYYTSSQSQNGERAYSIDISVSGSYSISNPQKTIAKPVRAFIKIV